MNQRTSSDMDEVLAEKNAVIRLLSEQNVALRQRVDQLASDLAKSEQFIEYIRHKLTGIPPDAAF